MAHYYAKVAGSRAQRNLQYGSATGTKTSGIRTSAQSDQGSVVVQLHWYGSSKHGATPDTAQYDQVVVETHEGSRETGDRTVLVAPLKNLLNSRTRTWTKADYEGECENCGVYFDERLYRMQLLYPPIVAEVVVELCGNCIAELFSDTIVICIPEGDNA